jgi:hypothetical protein
VFPVGSTEQHAYLSLETDNILAERASVEAAEALGVPVLPVLPYGVNGFTAYPGKPHAPGVHAAEIDRDYDHASWSENFPWTRLRSGPAASCVTPRLSSGPACASDPQTCRYSRLQLLRQHARTTCRTRPRGAGRNCARQLDAARTGGVRVALERRTPPYHVGRRRAGISARLRVEWARRAPRHAQALRVRRRRSFGRCCAGGSRLFSG